MFDGFFSAIAVFMIYTVRVAEFFSHAMVNAIGNSVIDYFFIDWDKANLK
ncbi:hypothetical protein H6F98_02100 [Microcoleus sp. FACHB-SPT15]|nr:hypothetical protein [Microcoleus sp. FACHB-SPT15]MBD1804266.1 hypothetical protein [Microcoleus sp. FACHB-SPT15]